MLAILYVLQHCGHTIHIATDYLPAVAGFLKGRRWCVGSRNKFADVWLLIWRRIEDIGIENVQITKVPGHTPWLAVTSGSVARDDKIGNDRADERAKGHARASTRRDDVVEVEHIESRVCEVAKWLLQLGGELSLARDTSSYDRRCTKPPRPLRERVRRVTGHVWRYAEGRYQCMRCPQWTRRPGAITTRCVDTPFSYDLTAPEWVGEGHQLWCNGQVLFCLRCGRHSERRRQGLALACGPPTTAGLNAIKALKAGKRPAGHIPFAHSRHLRVLYREGNEPPAEHAADQMICPRAPPLDYRQIRAFVGLDLSGADASLAAGADSIKLDGWYGYQGEAQPDYQEAFMS
jgi:hypothetical protein